MHSPDWAYGVGNATLDKTVPAAVTLSSPSHAATTVNLAWTAARDTQSGIASYDVYKAGVKVASLADGVLSYQATGLTTATAYAFTVKVVDGAGNTSASSNTVSVTTS
jgi:chitodextrinase